jgi:putative membrane protein
MRTLGLETSRFSALHLYAGLVCFSVLGTLFSHFTHVSPGPIAPVAAAATLLVGIAALLSPQQGSLGAALRALAFGAGIELIGLTTGWPFGSYRYTDRWWPVVSTPDGLLFPVLVPFAWILVAGGAHLAVGDQIQPKLRPVLAGLLAALCDLVMEPVMTGSLGYWTWTKTGPLPGGAPILNFFGWWLAAGIASWLLQRGGWERPGNGRAVLGLHMALVVLLGVVGR